MSSNGEVRIRIEVSGINPGDVKKRQDAFGICAVQLAHRAGARVIATCRAKRSMDIAAENGADPVLLMDGDFVRSVHAIAPGGVDHIVEMAFGENIGLELELLAAGGSIAAYATHAATPQIPFWDLLFKNVSIHLVGSDDVPAPIKVDATHALNRAIEHGWSGIRIAELFALGDIVRAHETMEAGRLDGRMILTS